MQATPQFHFDRLKLGPQSLRYRLRPHDKSALRCPATQVREAQEVEGRRFPVPLSRSIPGRKTPKFEQAGLLRVPYQGELCQSCAQFPLKLLRFSPMLEAQHDVIGVPHNDHISLCVSLPPVVCPEVKRIVKVDVREDRADYASYKVAKNVVECSTSIPRAQLRPSYGAGFLGAPLTLVKPDAIPPERERGGRHGTSSTGHDPGAGGQRHV
jgi:hypothetical protein